MSQNRLKKRTNIFFLVIIFLSCEVTGEELENINVYYVSNGETIYYQSNEKRRGFFQSDLNVYCYKGDSKNVYNIFQSVFFQVTIDNSNNFNYYKGSSPEIVKEQYDQQKSLFAFNIFSVKKNKFSLNPLERVCLGIDTLWPYSITLNVVRVDFIKFFGFCMAVLIFYKSKILSKNALFYYLTCIISGISASFLILLFLAAKLIPKRSMMVGVFAGGSTLGFYLLHLLWNNISVIMTSYIEYLVVYIFVTGLISFVISYRYGPPNQRTKSLIEWCLQFISLFFIYITINHKEVSVTLAAFIFFSYYLPSKYLQKISYIYLKWFPPKRKFLTLEEYELQGRIETKKALEELRKYCSSPECKQWRVMTTLKNPKRFASFIEGENHIMDEEIFDHETSINDLDEYENYSENSDSVSDDVEYISKNQPYKDNSANKSFNGYQYRNIDLEQRFNSKSCYRSPIKIEWR